MSRCGAPRQVRRAEVAGLSVADRPGTARIARLARPTIAAIAAIISIGGLAGCGPPTSGKSAVELYEEHCLRCHGADGHGDPRALGLAPNSDLSRSLLIQKRARGPIYLRITQGYGAMPGFSHKLEQGDVELLVDYLLELERP